LNRLLSVLNATGRWSTRREQASTVRCAANCIDYDCLIGTAPQYLADIGKRMSVVFCYDNVACHPAIDPFRCCLYSCAGHVDRVVALPSWLGAPRNNIKNNIDTSTGSLASLMNDDDEQSVSDGVLCDFNVSISGQWYQDFTCRLRISAQSASQNA